MAGSSGVSAVVRSLAHAVQPEVLTLPVRGNNFIVQTVCAAQAHAVPRRGHVLHNEAAVRHSGNGSCAESSGGFERRRYPVADHLVPVQCPGVESNGDQAQTRIEPLQIARVAGDH